MIPIFIITCDRLELLKQSIHSYHMCIKTLFDIVICDQGSTYSPTVDYLKALENCGTKVYWWNEPNDGKGQNKRRDEVHVRNSVNDYFTSHPQAEYVVTDPDIALDDTPGNILEVYCHLLETFPKINVVGPMLRIDDIPDCYPLKADLLSGKLGLHKGFHLKEVHETRYENTVIRYINAPIDTTFGLHRIGAPWARLKNGIRVLPPYGAKHLDWYVDPKTLTPDQAYYMKHASTNSHWSKWNG